MITISVMDSLLAFSVGFSGTLRTHVQVAFGHSILAWWANTYLNISMCTPFFSWGSLCCKQKTLRIWIFTRVTSYILYIPSYWDSLLVWYTYMVFPICWFTSFIPAGLSFWVCDKFDPIGSFDDHASVHIFILSKLFLTVFIDRNS